MARVMENPIALEYPDRTNSIPYNSSSITMVGYKANYE